MASTRHTGRQPKHPEGQSVLFEFDTERESFHHGKQTHGEYVGAILASVEHRRGQHQLDEGHSAAVALLVAGGRALEAMEARSQTYGPAKLLPAMTEILRSLHMTVDTEATAVEDSTAALIEALAAPPAPVDAR